MYEAEIIRNNNQGGYREMQRKISEKVREAKVVWNRQKCTEIEEYNRRFELLNLHKNLKTLAGLNRSKTPPLIYQCQLDIWMEYVSQLFKDSEEEIQNAEIENIP